MPADLDGELYACLFHFLKYLGCICGSNDAPLYQLEDGESYSFCNYTLIEHFRQRYCKMHKIEYDPREENEVSMIQDFTKFAINLNLVTEERSQLFVKHKFKVAGQTVPIMDRAKLQDFTIKHDMMELLEFEYAQISLRLKLINRNASKIDWKVDH